LKKKNFHIETSWHHFIFKVPHSQFFFVFFGANFEEKNWQFGIFFLKKLPYSTV